MPRRHPQFAALFIRPALGGVDDDGDPSQPGESCSVFFYIVYFNKVFTIINDLKAHKIVISARGPEGPAR